MLLTLSALALLCVIATQDYLVPSLRNATISSGLTGPYHVMLDVAYVPLAAALVLGRLYAGFSPAMEWVACVAATLLLLVAATNTAWRWFDLLTDGGHAKLHSTFTTGVFVAAIVLQCLGDHGPRWALTVANIAIPAAGYAYFHYHLTKIDGIAVEASPAAEKLFVLGLCLWLMLWGHGPTPSAPRLLSVT